MNFEKEWEKALKKAGMLQTTDHEDNIYIPAKKRRVVWLLLERSRKKADKAKPFRLGAAIWKPGSAQSTTKALEIPGITDHRFKTRKELREFRTYLVQRQPIASITFRNVYKEGGRIHIVNDGVDFTKEKYQAIFGDYDKDGIANIDDANPLERTQAPVRVEQVEAVKTFDDLLALKSDLDKTMGKAVDKLDDFSPKGSKIYARTKTPFSIVKKLVEKRLTDKEKGLKDLIGTTIATEDYDDLVTVRDNIRKGAIGKVVEEENMYSSPKAGYRAYHFIVEMDGTPIEVQLKTKRMKAVNEFSHKPYKKGTVNVPFQEKLTALVVKADRGDKKAVKEIEQWLSNPEALMRKLDLDYK